MLSYFIKGLIFRVSKRSKAAAFMVLDMLQSGSNYSIRATTNSTPTIHTFKSLAKNPILVSSNSKQLQLVPVWQNYGKIFISKSIETVTINYIFFNNSIFLWIHSYILIKTILVKNREENIAEIRLIIYQILMWITDECTSKLFHE